MKGLCVALLVFLGHQALANPKRKQQHSKLNSVVDLKDQVEIGARSIQVKAGENCGGEYATPSGTIRHPESGENYQNNENCIWIIRTANPINITFISFDIERNYDFLYVRDGERLDGFLLDSYTGSTIPNSVQTTLNAATIQFTSDYIVTTAGFELNWESSGCGAEYNSSSGMIQYPQNGGNYRNEENCIWIIRTEVPIQITFVNFDIELNYDYLYVRDGAKDDSQMLSYFTGSSVPGPLQTSTNSAYLLFTSDRSVTRSGFELHWEPVVAGCGGEYNSNSGTIRHPQSGGDYQNNEFCIWVIRAAEPINIRVISIDTEEAYDYLYVLDGESVGSLMISNFTGDSVPRPVQTSTNAAYLIFTSDISITSTGFELQWELASDPCWDLGGVQIGSQCLYFSAEELSWDNATAACANYNGQLASLADSPDEVLAYVVTNYDIVQFWAGGSDTANEGSWMWLNGQQFNHQFPWLSGNPNNAYGSQNCLAVNFEGGYDDQRCFVKHQYICELASTIRPTRATTTTISPTTFATSATESISSSYDYYYYYPYFYYT